MAADWIKMRTDLYRDPKVILMANALLDKEGELAQSVKRNCVTEMCVTRNVTRYVTVGALVTVWGNARHNGHREGDDLRMNQATVSVLDDITELPGFGKAMELVGWVVEDEEGIVFPQFFKEHNADPRQGNGNGAERQRRYRANQKLKTVTSPVTSPVTSRDASRNDRVEKSRVEKSINTYPPMSPQQNPGGRESVLPKETGDPTGPDPVDADPPPASTNPASANPVAQNSPPPVEPSREVPLAPAQKQIGIKMVKAWNATCALHSCLVPIRWFSEKRLAMLRDGFDERPQFEALFYHALQKLPVKQDIRNWQPNFDWMLQVHNLIKLIEGQFDERPKRKQTPREMLS